MQIKYFRDSEKRVLKTKKKLKKERMILKKAKKESEKIAKMNLLLKGELESAKSDVARLERELRRTGRDRDGFIRLERTEDTR